MVEGCTLGEDGTAYQTLEGLPTHDAVMKDLELHLEVHRISKGMSSVNNKTDAVPESRPDRFPRPEIYDPASETEWSYFLESWDTYKRATSLKGQNACDQLWHCPSDPLKKKLFNSGIRPTNPENVILEGIKKLCVKAHNNLVNIMAFQEIQQHEGEHIQQYAARLNGAASACDFSMKCTCEKIISFSERIQAFQFIRGLGDTEIQERILAETSNKEMSLTEIVKFSEAVETGKRSSSAMLNTAKINNLSQKNTSNKKCAFCGDNWHSGTDWRKLCRASNINCNKCGKKGHMSKVCRSKKSGGSRESNLIERIEPSTPSPEQEGDIESLGFFFNLEGEVTSLSHVGVNQFGKWASKRIEDHPEVQIGIRVDTSAYTDLKLSKPAPTTKRNIQSLGLADTGAQMVVMGLNIIYALGIRKKDLVPVGMKIKAANMGGLKLLGGIPVVITGLDRLGTEKESRQLAYIAEDVKRIFLSKSACKELGIIGDRFPEIGAYSIGQEMGSAVPKIKDNFIKRVEINNIKPCTSFNNDKCNCPIRTLPPELPTECPYPPTMENLDRIEAWIRDRYKASSFNTCNQQPLPLMSDSPPLKLFIDEKAIPVACHKAAQIPIHFKQTVEEELRRDVKLGVLEEVPPNTPTTWCSRMCIQTKKNGKPRRVIDLQPVNKHAVRQTYMGASPFEIVNEIPIHTFRTTLDAWNGYHSVPIHEEDRHVTTFIIPWGRFRYRTTPQEFLAA